MEENKTIVAPTIVPATTTTAVVTEAEDAEARYKKIEEEKENYRKAYLKEKSKNKSDEDIDETEDDKMARIASKVFADSKIVTLAQEQDALLTKVFKENKELKLAQLNKTTASPSGAIGTHSESIAVRDTLITPEQDAFFKSKGWGAKEIERYKRNLAKNSRG